jgi:hypothetical protein
VLLRDPKSLQPITKFSSDTSTALPFVSFENSFTRPSTFPTQFNSKPFTQPSVNFLFKQHQNIFQRLNIKNTFQNKRLQFVISSYDSMIFERCFLPSKTVHILHRLFSGTLSNTLFPEYALSLLAPPRTTAIHDPPSAATPGYHQVSLHSYSHSPFYSRCFINRLIWERQLPHPLPS